MKKLLRTFQVNFPHFVDAKFAFMRLVRNTLRVPFEEDFHALSLFHEIDNVLFLDVGANRGQSADAVLMHQRNVRLQLFEPNRLMYDKLERLFRDDKRISVNNFGLADEKSEQVLFVPFYKKWMFDGLASFNEQEAGGWLKGRMYFYDDRLLTLQKSVCRIERLDDLELKPFFIKLDIQGYEFKALVGGESTLKSCQPVLLIETPDDRTIEYLRGLGYQLYAYRRGTFIRGAKGSLNTFFMTEEKASLVRDHIA